MYGSASVTHRRRLRRSSRKKIMPRYPRYNRGKSIILLRYRTILPRLRVSLLESNAHVYQFLTISSTKMAKFAATYIGVFAAEIIQFSRSPKCVWGRGSAPGPRSGSLQCSPDSISGWWKKRATLHHSHIFDAFSVSILGAF